MSKSLLTADRALQVLAAFDTHSREMSVGRIADTLGIHKSTASRLAAALVGRHFLERTRRTLRLGPEVSRLGALALGDRELTSVASEAMHWLCGQTGETVHLAILDGTKALNVAQVDGPAIVGIGNWVGRRTDLHCAANGKVLLAYAPANLLKGPLAPLTQRTITSARTLRAHLELVRERGWASNDGELEEGLNAVATPVFDATGACRAALSVSGPSYRVRPDRFPALAGECKQAADRISARLGYAGPALPARRKTK